MKAAEPLYGGNFAVLNLSEQLRNFVLTKNKIAFFILQFEMRAADVAGVGAVRENDDQGDFYIPADSPGTSGMLSCSSDDGHREDAAVMV